MSRAQIFIVAFLFCPGLLSQAEVLSADDSKDDAPSPPADWKEFSPKDESYRIFVPKNTASQRKQTSWIKVKSQRLTLHLFMFGVKDGPVCSIEELILPSGVADKINVDEWTELLRDQVVKTVDGKVTKENDVTVGKVCGKEYYIDAKNKKIRARMFVNGTQMLTARAQGTAEQVDGDASKIFFDSLRLRSQ